MNLRKAFELIGQSADLTLVEGLTVRVTVEDVRANGTSWWCMVKPVSGRGKIEVDVERLRAFMGMGDMLRLEMVMVEDVGRALENFDNAMLRLESGG